VLVGDGPARAQLQGACPEALLVGSKTGDDLAVVQATDLFRVAFHHGVAERNLAVAAHDDFAVAAD